MNASPLRREVAATLKLAAPLVGAQLAQMSMSFVDVVMVGRLGTSALAAAVLGSTAFFTLALICIGVILAVNPTVAQAVGAGDEALAARATRQGLWLALILGAPLFIALTWAEEGLVALGQAPETAALAGEYLGAIRWGIVPNLAFTALRGFYEGTGRARPVLLATLVGVAVNIAANDVLMYGRLGFPALGLEGTGWSSALVFAAMAASLALGLRVSPTLRRYGVLSGLRTPDPAMLGTLVRLGLPIGATFGLEAGLFSAATLLVGWLGETPLAAHQIALNAASFTFMVPLGIGMAATVRVGQRVGAGDAAGARRAGFVAVALGASFMACAATFLWLRPGWVVFLYAGAVARGRAGLARDGAARHRGRVPTRGRHPGDRRGSTARDERHPRAHAHRRRGLLGRRAERGRCAGVRRGLGRQRPLVGPDRRAGDGRGAARGAVRAARPRGDGGVADGLIGRWRGGLRACVLPVLLTARRFARRSRAAEHLVSPPARRVPRQRPLAQPWGRAVKREAESADL